MSIRRFKLSQKLLTILLTIILTCFCFYVKYNNCEKPTLSFSSKDDEKRDVFKLVVMVLSAPNNVQERETIRRTWLSEKYENVKTFFVVGTLSLEENNLQSLITEDEVHKDLMLIADLKDSYESLTKKILKSFEQIHRKFDFQYLLKCDDDSYVVLEKVLKELDKWEAENISNKELYWGFFNGKAQVKRNGPWKETNWIFCDFYLPYALGGGYILSQRLVSFVAENSKILKIFNSEDVSVGLWLAPLSNVERKHDVRFDTEYKSRGCSNEYIVTHKQNPDSMKNIHGNYKASKTLCNQEVRHRNSYRYDWSVPPSKCCVREPGIP